MGDKFLAALVVLCALMAISGIGLLLFGDAVQGSIALVGAAVCFAIAWKGLGTQETNNG